MTREDAIKVLNMVEAHGSLVIQAKEMAIKALEQCEPCEDCISRQAVLNILDYMTNDYAKSNDFEKVNGVAWVKVQKLPPVTQQEPKTDYELFCKWVAREIFSENWEYNKESFAEIACRKLSKLGLVVGIGGVWELVESEDMITHIEAVQDNLNRMVDGLDDDTDYYDATYHLEQIKEKVEQEPKTDYKAFAEWVSTEIFSKDWEYNKDSFAEIACRKLNKLGVVDTDGTMWIYENEALEQEPKVGRWIHTEECDEEWPYRCSKCDMPSRSNAHRYCSNCGSYMYGTKMESEG